MGSGGSPWACSCPQWARPAPEAFGAVTFVFAIGQVAGPAVAGVVAERAGSFGSSFIMASVLAGLAVLLSLALKKLTHAGFFALQTHGKPVWYRNIRVKPLKALGKCPKCGKEGPVGWYCCAKCNTVCAPAVTVKCDECKQTAKAGTFCAKGNLFHLPAAGVECGECGNKPGMACEMDLCGYAFCSGAWYCDKCKKPYPYKAAPCPKCKK